MSWNVGHAFSFFLAPDPSRCGVAVHQDERVPTARGQRLGLVPAIQRPGWLAVDGLAGRRLLHAGAQSLGCQPGSLAVGHPRRLPATAQPSQPAQLAGANVNINGRLLLAALPSPGTGTMLHPSAVISREAGVLRGWSRKSSPRASRERRSKGPADASQ